MVGGQLGGMLFDSLHTKLLALPDQTLVYPAHGAGSLCGKEISKETVSTLGEQRRSNYALQPMSKEAFIQLVTADQPEAPAYFNYDAVLNSQERPTLDQALAREMNPLTLERVLELQSQGAQILDTRDSAEFAAAHLAGSINIGLVGQFATWAGTVLDRKHPIVIIADPGPRERIGDSPGADRVRSRGRVFEGWIAQPEIAAGFDSDDGAAQRAVRRRFVVVAASRRWRSTFATPRERDQKSIAGSLGIPLNHLMESGGTTAEGPFADCLLCWRLSVVDRGEFIAKPWIFARQRNCRRDRGLGSGEVAGSKCAGLDSEVLALHSGCRSLYGDDDAGVPIDRP